MNKDEIRNCILKLAREYVSCIEGSELNKPKSYIPVSGKLLGAEELCNMLDASLDMWLTAGRFNDEFESEFAKRLGIRYAITTNSGSSANLLAFSALTSPKLQDRAIKKGDEVISVASGFPTTIAPIIQCGAIPVFVDSEIGTYNIDVNLIERSITNKTKAIFLAHTLGNMYDMDLIMSLAKKYNLWVIEDSCDALGAKWNGCLAGTIGHIGTFSFYPAHHITMGEGGAVVTNDPILNRIILSFRDWGRDCWCKPGCDNTCNNRFCMKIGDLPEGYDHKYTYSHIGYNLKITDWQAAIGLAQLKKLDYFLNIRKENAYYLLKSLKDLSQYLILPQWLDKCEPSWFGFLISVRENAPFTKQQLVEFLESHGVGTRQLFGGNILRQPMIRKGSVFFRILDSDLINSSDLNESIYSKLSGAEFIMNHTFWIGVSHNLTIDDVRKSSALIHEFVGNYS